MICAAVALSAYQVFFYLFLLLFVVFLGITIYLFFKLKIASVIEFLTGIRARRTIRQLQENTKHDREEERERQARQAKKTGALNSERLDEKQPSEHMSSEKIGRRKSDVREIFGQSAVLHLDDGDTETEDLSAVLYRDEDTPETEPLISGKTPEDAFQFRVVREKILVHTDEVIKM
ncbi:MAG: hypothetical protein J5825_00130 [Lachnospiraceae bacterium]|nr:hypothetical protein [Lachnospiraceae bacterium]